MTKNETVSVRRHSLLYRILHWLIVFQVLLLIVTGFGVSEYISLEALGRGFARNLHVVVALSWTGTITFFIYYFIVSEEYRWFGLARLGQAVDFFAHEVSCFIKGKKVKSPIGYDAAQKKYAEKVILTEVLAWWGWFALWCAMILTGLALLFPGSFGFIDRICLFVLPGLGKAAMATRFVHLVISVFMIVFALIHAYASWTFGMVGSMVSGVNKEPIAGSGE